MKEYVEILHDSFIDFKGQEHHFTLAAISEVLASDGFCPIVSYHLSRGLAPIGVAEKGIKIGLSICNPADEFSEEKGALKAVGRARNAEEYSLYSNRKGQLNSSVIRAFLLQEADYIKKNPELFIAGYKDAKEKYLKDKEIEDIKNNFTETERIVVDNLSKNPHFLDNVQKYLDWTRKKNRK